MTHFGFHLTTGSRNGWGQVAPLARGIVSFLTDGFQEAHQDTYRVWRHMGYGSTEHLDIMPGFNHLTEADMPAQAAYWWPILRGQMQAERARLGVRIDAIKCTNEVGGNDVADIRKLIAFERALMTLAEADNEILVFGNLATATPHWDLWMEHYVPFIREGWRRGHIYSRHAYIDAPGGYAVNVERVAAERDALGDGAMILGEFGFIGYPGQATLMTALQNHDAWLQELDIGFAALFTYGDWLGPNGNANIQDASPALIQYLQERPFTRWTPAPPAPPPVPCPGQPRVQYNRVVNVIPNTATEAQAVEIFRVAWRSGRQTVGGSYDDAGIGALNNKTARLHLLPTARHEEFRRWYAEHYPGTVVEFVNTPPPPPPPTRAVVGLHASADPGALYGGAAEVAEFQTLRPGVVKILSAHSAEAVTQLVTVSSGAVWIIRAFLHWGGRNVTPGMFVNWTINDVARARAVLRGHGVPDERIWVELHNEPNLVDEGWTLSWNDGAEFALWGMQVLHQYRQQLPTVRYLYPGLSPGGNVPGLRTDAARFLTESESFIRACDGVAVHGYWLNTDDRANAVNWVNSHQRFAKPLWVTEASYKSAATAATIAAQYDAFLREVRAAGVTFFVASASEPAFQVECWVVNGHTRGIAAELRRRLG